MLKHTWAKIAPELDFEGGHNSDAPEVWSWCIRCGCLKLGDAVFVAGPDQEDPVKSLSDPGCHEKWDPADVQAFLVRPGWKTRDLDTATEELHQRQHVGFSVKHGDEEWVRVIRRLEEETQRNRRR